MDDFIYMHKDKIQNFAYISTQLSRYDFARIKELKVSDRARLIPYDVGVYGIIPSMFDTTIKDFMNLDY
jgi:hypothetical protein